MSISISILDDSLETLIYYCDNEDLFGEPDQIINDSSKLNLQDSIKWAVFDKFYRDGYVQRKYLKLKGIDQKGRPIYYISFDGLLFHNKGGYAEQIKSEERIKRRQIILDYALIFGSASAVVLAFASLIDFLLNLFCSC